LGSTGFRIERNRKHNGNRNGNLILKIGKKTIKRMEKKGKERETRKRIQ